MNITLLRHGKTQGNVERRYIGTTDEPLCPAGISALKNAAANGIYPPVQCVYVSPLLRCTQTAALLYQDTPQRVMPDLREQAFGIFENKTYEELQFLPSYSRWLESAGEAEIPAGESHACFYARVHAAFWQCIRHAQAQGFTELALVAHGGVLMAILSEFCAPKQPFYTWQAANGGGFCAAYEAENKQQGLPLELLYRIDCEALK